MSLCPQPSEIESQSPECVATKKVTRENRRCLGAECGIDISFMHGLCKYCPKCNKQRNAARDIMASIERDLHTIGKNIAFRHFNRDRYISFDGKYEGPLNKCDTRVEVLKKDHGYHAMPIDVHVRPEPARFNNVTPDDVDWAARQRNFPHSLSMPRVANNFCVYCTEAVVNGAKNEVRVTRGVYLPIKHDCPRVRVYDLQGKLIEVI